MSEANRPMDPSPFPHAEPDDTDSFLSAEFDLTDPVPASNQKTDKLDPAILDSMPEAGASTSEEGFSQATDLSQFDGMGTLPLQNTAPLNQNIDAGLDAVFGKDQDFSDGFLQQGHILSLNDGAYEVVRRLGKQTGESQVYLLKRTDGSPLVMKYYYPGFRPKMHILQDLMNIHHPGIIRILDAGYYRNQFFELLEYAAGGDLLQQAPIQDAGLLRRIVSEAAEALRFCHEHQIVHRDIKPDNLFFRTADQTEVILGDFGISSKMANDEMNQLTSQSRTPIYAAPEVYQSIAGKTVIQPEVDYYSLGMTLLYLWTGKNPFKGLNEFQIMQAKTQGQLQPPPEMPESLRQLIKGLLTVRTVHRWAYPEIQRWLAGEKVEVFEARPQAKPFKFGSDSQGEAIEAADPADLAYLLKADSEKGAQYLHNGAIKNWLEHLGEQEMALEVSQLVETYPGTRAIAVVVYTLNPRMPLLLDKDVVATSPVQLARWIYGEAQDWVDEAWPASYHRGLELLESGELLAWLRAQGHQALAAEWSSLGLYPSVKGLENILRILDPNLPPVRLNIDGTAFKKRLRLKPDALQELFLAYQAEGQGLPYAEMVVYAGTERRQYQLINARKGKIRVLTGKHENKAQHLYRLRIEMIPDANTILSGDKWELAYRVRYPWQKVGRPLLAAVASGAVIGLAARISLAYRYPRPLSSYLGARLTPAEAHSYKDPYLDYAACGWAFTLLILLNFWLSRVRANSDAFWMLKEGLGAPAFAGLAALCWWQWKQIHVPALRCFYELDKIMAHSGLPLLASYALSGAVIGLTLSLLEQDSKLIDGPLRWRALVLPMLLGLAFWQLNVSATTGKHPAQPAGQTQHTPKPGK